MSTFIAYFVTVMIYLILIFSCLRICSAMSTFIANVLCLLLKFSSTIYVYVHSLWIPIISSESFMSTSIANLSMSWYILFQCSYVYVSSNVFMSTFLLHHFYVYVHYYNISISMFISIYHPWHDRFCFSVLMSTLVLMCLYLRS